MATSHLKENLDRIKSEGFFEQLEIIRGIERESLRVTKNNKISSQNHPTTLGAALCSDVITTDFAEALIELVTPTFDSRKNLYNYLYSLTEEKFSQMLEDYCTRLDDIQETSDVQDRRPCSGTTESNSDSEPLT